MVEEYGDRLGEIRGYFTGRYAVAKEHKLTHAKMIMQNARWRLELAIFAGDDVDDSSPLRRSVMIQLRSNHLYNQMLFYKEEDPASARIQSSRARREGTNTCNDGVEIPPTYFGRRSPCDDTFIRICEHCL